jgi:hypothetical protein
VAAMIEKGGDNFVCRVGLMYAEWVVAVFGVVGGECEFGGALWQVGDRFEGWAGGGEWVVC